MRGLRQDIQYAARRFRRQPGAAAVTIATIGLAVGLTTAVYSIAAAVLLRPLPFAQPDRLVAIWRTAGDVDFVPVPIPEFFDLQSRSASLEDIAGLSPDGRTVVAPGVTEWADVLNVTPNLFDLLGVPALAGRTSLGAGPHSEADRVVILTEGFWRRVFGADPAIVGRRIRLAGRDPSGADDSYEVLGIVPWDVELSYRRPLRADLFIPHVFAADERSDQRRRVPGLLTFGRVKPDSDLVRSDIEVRAIMAELVDEHLTTSLPDADARVVSLHEELVGQTRPAVALLGWGSVAILLMACVNVTHLLLAAGVRRTRELVIRIALGCSRRRLLRQLLTEHLLLACVGGVTGVLLALGLLPFIDWLLPTSLPRADQVRIDGGVLAFAAAVSALAGVLSGCLPAWLAVRPRQTAPVAVGQSVSPGARRTAAALVITQAALVLVLLAGAGLLAASFARIGRLDLGFEPADVLVVQIELPERLANQERASLFEGDLLLRVRSLPGVARAATSDQLPFASGSLAGVALGADDVQQVALVSVVDPEYLPLLGVPLRRGRMLLSTDRGRADVAVVSESLARLFAEGRALGRRIRVARQWREVVGVVGDTTELGQIHGSAIRRTGALSRLTLPSAFVPSGTASRASGFFLVVHSRLSPADIALAVRDQIGAIDSEVSIRRASTLQAQVEAASSGVRFQMLLAWVFAGMALLLAVVGLYGVLATTVGYRIREIGVRMALGAAPDHVRWLIARHAVVMVLSGMAIGLMVVVTGGRALQSFLFEVRPLDPAILVAAVAVLLTASAAAAHFPVRRATRIDPGTVLRSE